MLFCDQCGKKYGFDAVAQERGECDICHQKIGVMNRFSETYLDALKDVETETFTAAGMTVKQIESLIPRQPIDKMHLDMIHKRINRDNIVFMNSHRVIILNESTGYRIEISL